MPQIELLDMLLSFAQFWLDLILHESFQVKD